TALAPPVTVILSSTCPRRFHTRYRPFWNPEMERVSRIVPLSASTTSTRSARAPLPSQSRQYSATWWLLPSLRLTSKVKLEPNQNGARRPLVETFCKARLSLVDEFQTPPAPVIPTVA